MHFNRQIGMQSPKSGECFAHPPSAHVVMTANALGQPVPQVVAVFPPRPADGRACGEWSKAEEVEGVSVSSPILFPRTMTGFPSVIDAPEDAA